MDGKGALAKPLPTRLDTSLDAAFRGALGTPVIFPVNDSDSDSNSDSSQKLLHLGGHSIGTEQQLPSQTTYSKTYSDRYGEYQLIRETSHGVARRYTNGKISVFPHELH